MARLITFGASYAYGHGLVDSFDPKTNGPGPNPSVYSWPSLLANKLNLECLNLSNPGASNLQILDTILNFKFEPDDVVFVMWVDKDRDMIYLSEKEKVGMAHWVNDKRVYVKEWLLAHPTFDLQMKSWLHMHHAFLHLQPYKFYFLDNWPTERFYDYRPDWAKDISVLTTNTNALSKKYPKALDGIHPGDECHRIIAESIYKEIT